MSMDLSRALQRVTARLTLERSEAREVFARCLSEGVDPSQLGALLGALAARGEDAAEIAGAAEALRDVMVPFVHDHPDAIDTAGTGGDGLSSFNLSTAAAIVAAAAGARVIKHGNRSQSSRCGSADLLECAGIPLDLSPDHSRRILDEVGITFLFAPAYHPALKHAAPVRRALGVRTVFNFLGPLANPGSVRRQLIGVPEERRVGEIARVLSELGHERGYVVHGAGGADELSLAGANRVQAVGSAPEESFAARELGLAEAPCGALVGGDARTNLAILIRVLDGERGPVADAVVLNAAAAILVADKAPNAMDGVEIARDAILGGKALATFERWVELARRKESAA
jgi:anthranilate phosphoribosyltransferase